jgi:hypothetical protein
MARLGTAAWLLLLAGTCGFAGCGGPPTGQVAGIVTLKGQPIGGAKLVFVATTNPDDVFHGASSRDGKYQVSYRELNGLPVGRYQVTIAMHTLPNGQPFVPTEATEEFESEGRLVSSSYVFEQEIVAGQNTVDFELSQGRKVEAQ